MEDQYRRLLENELAVLKRENTFLKRMKQLDKELVALTRRQKNQRPEEELAALQAENQRLREREQVQEELSKLQSAKRRLEGRPGLLTEIADTGKTERMHDDNAKHKKPRLRKPITTGRKRIDGSVWEVAMTNVRLGTATLLSFSPEQIIAICGRAKRAVQRSDADDLGGWLSIFQAYVEFETPDQSCTCPVLYFNDQCVILAESLGNEGNEGTEALLNCLEECAEQIRSGCSNRESALAVWLQENYCFEPIMEQEEIDPSQIYENECEEDDY